jgi:hypothetical protein
VLQVGAFQDVSETKFRTHLLSGSHPILLHTISLRITEGLDPRGPTFCVLLGVDQFRPTIWPRMVALSHQTPRVVRQS